MAEILVLANETIGGEKLLDAIRERAREGDARFHVVVPLTRPRHGNVIYDEAVRDSAQVRVDLALAFMREEGIEGDGRGRRRRPVQRRDGRDRRARHRRDHRLDAARDALRLAAARPDRARCRRRPGLPVEHVVVDLAAEGLPFDVHARGRQPDGGRRPSSCRGSSSSPTRARAASSSSSRRTPATGTAVRGARERLERAARLARATRASWPPGMIGDPDPYTADDERRAVLPHLRDRHLDAARGRARSGSPTSWSSGSRARRASRSSTSSPRRDEAAAEA